MARHFSTNMEPKQEAEQPTAQGTGDKQFEVIKKTPEQRKAEKEEKKRIEAEKKAAKAAAKQAPVVQEEFVKDPNDPCASKFGDMELCRSQMSEEECKKRHYVAIKDIGEVHEGKSIRIRGRVHNSRAKGKMCFVVARESFATVQAVLFVGESISKGMVAYASKIPRESIIEIVAKVVKPSNAIEGCSIQHELQVEEIWTVNKSAPVLPF